MDNQTKEEDIRSISYASNVIRFLSDYIHGLINGKREDMNVLALRNASDQFRNLTIRSMPVPEQGESILFAEWVIMEGYTIFHIFSDGVRFMKQTDSPVVGHFSMKELYEMFIVSKSERLKEKKV